MLPTQTSESVFRLLRNIFTLTGQLPSERDLAELSDLPEQLTVGVGLLDGPKRIAGHELGHGRRLFL